MYVTDYKGNLQSRLGSLIEQGHGYISYLVVLFFIVFSMFFIAVNSAVASPLELTLTASADPVQDDTVLEFTATIANRSGSTVTGAEYQAVVPQYFYDLRTANTTPTWSSCSNGAQCYTGNVMSWILGDLGPGEVRVIRFMDRVDTSAVEGSLITVQANVNSDGQAPVQAERTVVVAETNSKLKLAIQASDDPVAAGNTLSYQLQFANQSGQDISGGSLTAELPAGVSLVSASEDGAQNGNAVHWSLAGQPAGVDGIRTLTVLVDAGLPEGELLQLDASFTATLADGTETKRGIYTNKQPSTQSNGPFISRTLQSNSC